MTSSMPVPPSPPEVTIVAAEGIDRRACRMLLPDRPGSVGWMPLVVAKDATTGAILGAAKGMPIPSPTGMAELRAAMLVPAVFRRRGIGSALLDGLVALARSKGFERLSAMPEAEEVRDAEPFLTARGFATFDRLTTFEARIDAMAAWLSERRRWLLERGAIPSGARIVLLPEAPIEPVALLHARAIGGDRAQLLDAFRKLAQLPQGRDTSVLLVDGIVRGFHQCEFKDDLSATFAIAVDESLRAGGGDAGWASLLLLAERVEACIGSTVVRARFSCLSNARATLRLAQVFDAEVVARRPLLVRTIDAPA